MFSRKNYGLSQNDYDNPLAALIAYTIVMAFLLSIYHEEALYNLLGSIMNFGEFKEVDGWIKANTISLNSIANILLSAFISELLSYYIYTSRSLSFIWHIISRLFYALVSTLFIDVIYFYANQIHMNYPVSLVIILAIIFLATRSPLVKIGGLVPAAKQALTYTVIVVVGYFILKRTLEQFNIEIIYVIGVIVMLLIGIHLIISSVLRHK